MTGTIIKILIVVAIFGVVLGATYPIQKQAVEEGKATNYDLLLGVQLRSTKARYEAAQQKPKDINELVAAGDAYAAALTSSQDFGAAAEIYGSQLPLTWGLVTDAYNEKWANANLRLAGVYRDMDSQGAALTCYESLLKYDQQYLPATDSRIARDLNNMGLMLYMIGLGKAEEPARVAEFQKSRNYLEQALALQEKINLGKSSRAAATLWNLFLTCRDLGDQKAAEQYRSRAQAIDKSLNRVCREP